MKRDDARKPPPSVDVQSVTLEDIRRLASVTPFSDLSNALASPSNALGLATASSSHVSNTPSSIAEGNFGVPVISAIDLGRLVRSAREGMRVSQQRFADLAGVGRRFISELENGKTTLELGRVLQVCRAAGIDVLAKRRQSR